MIREWGSPKELKVVMAEWQLSFWWKGCIAFFWVELALLPIAVLVSL